MAPTRAQVENILIRRVGAWLTLVSLDGVTNNGNNLDLNDPIGTALAQLGYSVANITMVASTDLASVSSADVPALLDLAELRALETIGRTYTDTEVSGLGYSIKSDQFGQRVAAAYAALKDKIDQTYGLGAITASPYAGGQTISDKEAREDDTDRVQPTFTKDLHRAPGTAPIAGPDDWWEWR